MTIKTLPADARPREKLLQRSATALSDAELLAILLRTGHVGRPVLQLAHDILAPVDDGGFGGIAGLLHAQADDLARIKGLGPAKRAVLLAVMSLAQRALLQQLGQRPACDSPRQVRELLQLRLGSLTYECFAVLYLDAQHRLIRIEELFRGTLNATTVYPREVVRLALQWNAAGVVLAHNHPSGNVTPSAADERLTRMLKDALSLIEVKVLDHVIVGPGVSLSMAERGLV